MATRKQVEEKATKLGCRVEFDESTFYIYTPKHFEFSATGTTTLVCPYNHGFRGSSFLSDACADALDELSYGIREREDDCDSWWWHEEEGED